MRGTCTETKFSVDKQACGLVCLCCGLKFPSLICSNRDRSFYICSSEKITDIGRGFVREHAGSGKYGKYTLAEQNKPKDVLILELLKLTVLSIR